MRTTVWAAAGLLALGALGATEGAGPLGRAAKVPAALLSDDTQDVLLLAEGRPVRMRLRLTVDGKPHTRAWSEFLAKLFAFLDRNGDGVLDREEVARAPAPQQLQQMFGGGFFNPRLGVRGVTLEALDANSDGEVSFDEFVRYYRRMNAGPVFVPPNTYSGSAPGPDALTEALFRALDTDKDGKLSKAELLAAEESLLRFDQNDDELVSAQELLGNNPPGFVRPPAPAMARGRPRPAGPGLVPVEKGEPGKRMAGRLRVARDVLTRYDSDGDGKLSPAEIALPRREFARLDTNRDGKLDVLELLRWTAGPPEVEVIVRLGSAGKTGPADLIGLAGPEPGPFKPRKTSANTLAFTLRSERVNVVRAGNGYAGSFPAYRNYLENLFRTADKARKGYVTAEQLRNQPQFLYLQGILALADRDGDGKLTRAELKAWLELSAMAAGRQVTVSFAQTGRGLFQAIDANGDGFLSVREMRTARARVADFDSDGDGYITRDEIPRQYQVTVHRGAVFGYAAAAPAVVRPRGRAARPAGPARGPLWFWKMDRNGDGDVSRSEFLGPKEDFDRIDADGDGLISPEEAEKADSWYRARLKKQ